MADAKTLPDFLPELPRPGVLCTIVAVVGSAPQAVGARMWAGRERFLGTLGGGELERRVLEHARSLLAREKPERPEPFMKEYVLCKELGQCCGGRVQVFFEPVPARRTVHLFGGGHVGRATAETLAGLPFETRVIDPRPEWAPSGAEDPLAYARSRAWSERDAACIFTHSHELDFELASFLLGTRVGFLGLIGSEHKARTFRARLEAQGRADLAARWDVMMRCPIGLPLPGKQPKAIAVAIAAQLLQEWAERPAEPAVL